MTAEFPDTSLAALEDRRALEASEQDELAHMDLLDLEAERTRREGELEELRGQCLPAQVRVVALRLELLRAEIERRGHW